MRGAARAVCCAAPLCDAGAAERAKIPKMLVWIFLFLCLSLLSKSKSASVSATVDWRLTTRYSYTATALLRPPSPYYFLQLCTARAPPPPRDGALSLQLHAQRPRSQSPFPPRTTTSPRLRAYCSTLATSLNAAFLNDGGSAVPAFPRAHLPEGVRTKQKVRTEGYRTHRDRASWGGCAECGSRASAWCVLCLGVGLAAASPRAHLPSGVGHRGMLSCLTGRV